MLLHVARVAGMLAVSCNIYMLFWFCLSISHPLYLYGESKMLPHRWFKTARCILYFKVVAYRRHVFPRPFLLCLPPYLRILICGYSVWWAFWRILAAVHHPSGCYTLVADEVSYPPHTHTLCKSVFECLEKRYINAINYYYYYFSRIRDSFFLSTGVNCHAFVPIFNRVTMHRHIPTNNPPTCALFVDICTPCRELSLT